MINVLRRSRMAVASAGLALLAACGGGGSPATPSPEPPSAGGLACTDPPEAKLTTLAPGVFTVALDGKPGEGALLVTTEPQGDGWGGGPAGTLVRWDGGATSPRPTGVTVFDTSYGCSESDKRASNARDLPMVFGDVTDGPRAVVVLTEFVPATGAVSGTVRNLDSSVVQRFSGAPIPGSSYDLAATPRLADIVGDWPLTDALGQPTALSVAADGRLGGSYQGCAFTGSIAASGGANLFRVALAIPSCAATAGLTDFRGYALAMPMSAGGAQLLLWAEAQNGVDYRYLLALGAR